MWNVMPPENLRKTRGFAILNRPEQIEQIQLHTFKVNSQSGNGQYVVTNGDEWDCTCPDHAYRDEKCKHIWAVELSLKLKEQVRRNTVIEPITVSECLFCRSPNIKKFGIRRNKSGNIQRFLCDDCEKNFITGNTKFDTCSYCREKLTLRFYFERDSSGEYETYVLEKANLIMGVLCIQEQKESLYLSRIGVQKGKKNLGYGKELILRVIERATDLGKKKITCKAHKKKISWFKEVGFKVIEGYSDPHWGESATMEYTLS
jgi:N-acetylglutamate synthase-like GNAT family acetyltransferase